MDMKVSGDLPSGDTVERKLRGDTPSGFQVEMKVTETFPLRSKWR